MHPLPKKMAFCHIRCGALAIRQRCVHGIFPASRAEFVVKVVPINPGETQFTRYTRSLILR
ncbi:MAG: hypothetical protein R3C26_18710 [Calditrichia bacterium]